MIVKIDNREIARVCNASKYYMGKYKIIIEELEIGDFIFSENNEEVVFEYKTSYDLVWSISEGRLFDQALKQAKNFKHHFVVVEWNENEKIKAQNQLKKSKIMITDSDIYESLARLSTFTTIIISPNKNQSFPMMEKYAEICFNEDPFEKTPPEKTDNVAYNFLMLIEGVNKIKARAICKKLNLKTVDDLFNLKAKQLVKVSGIGPITAQKIISSLKK